MISANLDPDAGRLRLGDVLDATAAMPWLDPSGVDLAALRAMPIHELAISSGAVEPGDLFVALPGTRTHGARFVPDAYARGALAALTPEAPALSEEQRAARPPSPLPRRGPLPAPAGGRAGPAGLSARRPRGQSEAQRRAARSADRGDQSEAQRGTDSPAQAGFQPAPSLRAAACTIPAGHAPCRPARRGTPLPPDGPRAPGAGRSRQDAGGPRGRRVARHGARPGRSCANPAHMALTRRSHRSCKGTASLKETTR
jgi:hypothetical protein